MSIIAKVGRRSFAVSFLIFTMYLLLTVGGISMIYPFLLMLATSMIVGYSYATEYFIAWFSAVDLLFAYLPCAWLGHRLARSA